MPRTIYCNCTLNLSQLPSSQGKMRKQYELLSGKRDPWSMQVFHKSKLFSLYGSFCGGARVWSVTSIVSDSLQHYGLQAPLSMGFSRQEYWSGLPCCSPGDLPNPGIEPSAPALQADSLPTELPGKPGSSLTVFSIVKLQNTFYMALKMLHLDKS